MNGYVPYSILIAANLSYQQIQWFKCKHGMFQWSFLDWSYKWCHGWIIFILTSTRPIEVCYVYYRTQCINIFGSSSWFAVQFCLYNSFKEIREFHQLDARQRVVQILCFWTLSIILFLSKSPSCFYLKTYVSETGFCLHLQVKPIQLVPIHRANPYLWTSKCNSPVLVLMHSLSFQTHSAPKDFLQHWCNSCSAVTLASKPLQWIQGI
jgi:hypothetical protein